MVALKQDLVSERAVQQTGPRKESKVTLSKRHQAKTGWEGNE